MATIRLVPSTYYLSNTSYLSVSNAANMYNNTDNETYATVTNSQNGTTSYYIYVRGFNFDDVPENAIVNSFTVRLKARESGVSTSSSYIPVLANGTATYSSSTASGTIGTTAATITFSGTTTWESLKSGGANFGIRINCRRSSRNTTAYMYIYGAEILVDYEIPDPCTVTSSLSGNGTIVPEGATETYVGETYSITITPDDVTEEVTATLDGVDITNDLVPGGQGGTLSCNLGTYSLVSGGFNGSGATYFQGIVGNGVNATQTTSNYYSSSSSTNAVFQYSMAFTNIPSNATITRVYVEVNGHAESTSNSNEYMCAQLKSGSTALTEQLNFKSVGTSNSTQTLECTTLPTVSQLASMVLECTLGYYGGAINGATAYVEYTVPSEHPSYYTYTFITTAGTHTLVVTIGSAAGDVLYIKINGAWKAVSKVYLKVNGAWVEQTNLAGIFDTRTKYIKEND